MCKMTPIGVRLNLKNLILISCAVLELLGIVSQGGGGWNPPPKSDRVKNTKEFNTLCKLSVKREENKEIQSFPNEAT